MGTLRKIADLSAEELNRLFGEATAEAVSDLWLAGLPVCGMKGDKIYITYPDGDSVELPAHP